MHFVFCSVSEGSMSSMISAGVISWYDKCVCAHVSKVLHG